MEHNHTIFWITLFNKMLCLKKLFWLAQSVYGGNLQVGSFEGYEHGLVFNFQTFQLPVEEEEVDV